MRATVDHERTIAFWLMFYPGPAIVCRAWVARMTASYRGIVMSG
jgi:hypothetical protein